MKAQNRRAALHDASLFAAFPNKAPGTSWQLHNENTFVIIMSGARDSLDKRSRHVMTKTLHQQNSDCRGHDLHNPRKDCSIAQLPNDSRQTQMPNGKWETFQDWMLATMNCEYSIHTATQPEVQRKLEG